MLKLSGEALRANGESVIDNPTLVKIAQQIKKVIELGVGVGGDGEDVLVAAIQQVAPFPMPESRRAFEQCLFGLVDLALLHQGLCEADQSVVILALLCPAR